MSQPGGEYPPLLCGQPADHHAPPGPQPARQPQPPLPAAHLHFKGTQCEPQRAAGEGGVGTEGGSSLSLPPAPFPEESAMELCEDAVVGAAGG